jgi:hypothetical protein
MHIRSRLQITLVAGVAAVLAFPLVAQQNRTTGPIARYDMRATTIAGATGRPGAGSMMNMMMGGGRSNTVQHELLLTLGSSLAPTGGAAHADHFVPQGAQMGKSLALVTPQPVVGTHEDRAQQELPGGRRPKGRMLLYWGCAEHAPAGQPVVIDFSKMAAGEMPAGLWSTTIPRDHGPTTANSRTYGEWPSQDGKYVKPESSLIGAHRVAGNYSPDMNFTLTKDFMAPLETHLTPVPNGSKVLGWNAVPTATGYIASMFGGTPSRNGEMGDMVMWSSSASREFGGGLSDWLTPAQVATLIRERTVLPPTTTSCPIPAEAIRDAGQFRAGTLTAFGPEESFAYPARPTDPHAVWNIQWTARIRHRSLTNWMDLPGMGEGYGRQSDKQPPKQQQPDCKPKKRGLGGLVGAISGLGGGNDPGC